MSMYIPALGRFERLNKRNARIIAMIFFILVVFVLLFPLLTFPDPPPGQEGITVNLGIPDVGQGNENAPEAIAQPVVEEEESEPEEEEVEEVEETKPEPVKPKPEKPDPIKEVVKTEDPEAIALRRQKEKERLEKERAEADARAEQKRKEAEAERERQKKAEAKRKAEAAEAKRKAEADALKDMLGGGLAGGDGPGKGDNGKPGNDGRLDGNPAGIGSVGGGSGTVQGFGSRGFKKPGGLKNTTNKSGKVVVEVCVDKSGRVISARKTLKGTTTSNSQLIKLAESHAKKYNFDRGSASKQCGTITYNFAHN